MNNELLEALTNLSREKKIPKEVLIDAIEAALISAYKKSDPDARKISVEFDNETGEVRVFNELLVVADEQEALDKRYPDTDEPNEDDIVDTILLDEARTYISDLDVGDTIAMEVTPENFGRIAALTAKQVILQRIREAERVMVLEKYNKRIGDIVTGRVQRVTKGEAFIELDGTMAKMTKNEKTEGEFYDTRPQNNELLKFLVIAVVDPSAENAEDKLAALEDDKKQGRKKRDKSILIYLSRNRKELVKRLFELEVPEIHDGVVLIKSISRRAGNRSKIAVHAVDINIDAVGACVGQRGSRVQRVVNELRGEKIDIVNWSELPQVFIANSISPAHALRVDLDEAAHKAYVVVRDDQLSLAIGPEGLNASLAAELTGWTIELRSESQDREQMANYEEEYEDEKLYEEDAEFSETDLESQSGEED